MGTNKESKGKKEGGVEGNKGVRKKENERKVRRKEEKSKK